MIIPRENRAEAGKIDESIQFDSIIWLRRDMWGRLLAARNQLITPRDFIIKIASEASAPIRTERGRWKKPDIVIFFYKNRERSERTDPHWAGKVKKPGIVIFL